MLSFIFDNIPSVDNQKGPKYPEGALPPDYIFKSDIQYIDSIDKNLKQFSKSQSLVYMLGDLSFNVEKFGATLFIEHAYHGAKK